MTFEAARFAVANPALLHLTALEPAKWHVTVRSSRYRWMVNRSLLNNLECDDRINDPVRSNSPVIGGGRRVPI